MIFAVCLIITIEVTKEEVVKHKKLLRRESRRKSQKTSVLLALMKVFKILLFFVISVLTVRITFL